MILVSCSSIKQDNNYQFKTENYTILSNQRLEPSRKGYAYIDLIETSLNNDIIFNTEKRDTKQIVLTGLEITLDATSKEFNNIYEKLVANRSQPRSDLEKLTIHCENLNIIGAVTFPQTNIIIYAKTVNFIDKDTITSFLSTTPIKYSFRNRDATRTEVAGNGLDGMPGGDIMLNIKEILYNSKTDDSTNNIRFDLSGGYGQNPGEGLIGIPGRDIPAYNNVTNGHGQIIWNVCDKFNKVPCENIIWIGNIKIGGWALQGSDIWPSNGGNAIIGGIPGEAGKGGNLTIGNNLISENLINSTQGRPGKKASNQAGGRPGQPNPAYKIVHNGPNFIDVYKKSTTVAGANALAPNPKTSSNLNGKIIFKNQNDWLSVDLVNIYLEYINDLYKSGYENKSKEYFIELYNTIKLHEAINSEYTSDWLFHKNSTLNSISKSIKKIDNNIDFYGNEEGWIPTLSLELMLKSYENQINSSFNELFLYHQLLNRVKNNQEYKNNLDVQTIKETARLNRIENILSNKILKSKELEIGINPLRDSIFVYQELIKKETNRLIELASTIVEDRSREDGIISKLKKLSEYVKIAGAIYTGGQSFGALGLVSSLEEIQGNISGLNEENEWKESTQTIEKLKTFSSDIDKISDLLDGLNPKKTVNNAEILEVFESLKNESEYYKDLVDKAILLADKSDNLNLQLVNILIEIQSEMEQLSISLHNKSILENKSITAKRFTDNDLIEIIEIRKKYTEDKIFKYQYYLLRSFEYEFLKTYITDFTLNKTYEEFERILSTSSLSNKLTDLNTSQINSLKSIYKKDIDNIVSLGIEDLNNRGKRTTTFIDYKFSKNDLKLLENGEKVVLNLSQKKLIFQNERMQKIVDIKISQFKVKKTSYSGVIRITVKHPSISIIHKGNNMYKFHHGDPKSYPFQWVYSYTQFDQQGLRTTNITNESLIKSFLFIDGKEENITDIRKYSLPSLITELEIEISIPPETKVDFKKLRLQIEYEFEEKFN